MNAQVDHRASEAGGEERPHDDIRPDDAQAPADAAGPDEAGHVEAGHYEPGPDEVGPDETYAVAAPVEQAPAEEWPSGPVVVQDAPTASPAALRVDFGAHLEANYQRLVAQLYAITLDAGEAHDVVQDAYSRAWRKWAEIGAGPDPTGWVRRVAVRSTQRGWRRVLERVGLARPRPVGDGDPRTAALLAALGRLGIAERRVVVLFHMVGMSRRDIAALEQVSAETVALRLRRAHQAVTEGMADELPSVLGVPATYDDPYTPHAGAERQY